MMQSLWRSYRFVVFTAVAFFLTSAGSVGSVRATGVEAADGQVGGGLVAYVGTTGEGEAQRLAGEGRYLVHVLLPEEGEVLAVRAGAIPNGNHGLISTMHWRDASRLPYASNLVNMLVVDADALGERCPTAEEMERVVVPGGVMMVKRDGEWERSIKPRPEGMDDWEHFDHGADGNAVSEDTFVEPMAQQQWITGVQSNPAEGNPAGYDPGAGLRVWDRFVVMDVKNRAAGEGRDKEAWELQGRDAFNGTPLWSVKRSKAVAGNRLSLVAAEGEVYCWLEKDGDLVALDIRDGNEVRKYEGTRAAEGVREEVQVVRVAGDRLLVGTGEAILMYDRVSGERRWKYEEEGRYLLAAVMDVERGRVYAIVAEPGDRRTFGSRWPVSKRTQAVVALNIEDGKRVWENRDVASRPIEGEKGKMKTRGIGQIVPGDGALIVYGSAAIGGGEVPFIASLDPEGGETLHINDEPFKRSYNVASYNLSYRDGAAYFAGAFTNIWRYDPSSGEVERVLSDSWNQRCIRLTATPRYFLFGQSGYYGPEMSGTQVTVTRSGCAIGNVPANGLTYFTPNGCGCITQVRGFQAMTGEETLVVTADDARLSTGGGSPVALTSPGVELPAGPVAADWPLQSRAGLLATEAVAAGGLELVAVVHQHRLEARRGEEVVWSFTADGRISSPPVLMGEVVVFGSHDGSVYGVSLGDGKPLWRYQLAPAVRLIGVNGQLENTWPVYGVARMGDRVIASAGTHVELLGGVTVAAVDPATGEAAWVKHLQKQHAVIPPGGKGARIVSHSFVNSVPRVEGETITLGDGGRRGGEFSFTVEETQEAINARINSPPPKRK